MYSANYIQASLHLMKADMRNIFRDKSLMVLLLIPFLVSGLLYWGIPVLEGLAPAVIPYRLLIYAVMVQIISVFPAFIFSFVHIDEKEQGLHMVYAITPMGKKTHQKMRGSILFTFTYLQALVLIIPAHLPGMKMDKIVLWALVVSFGALLVKQITCMFAKNKIEAMTILKLLNLFMMLPAGIWFLPDGYAWFLGFLPQVWAYKASFGLIQGDFYLYIVLGLAVYFVWLQLIDFLKK